MRLRFEITRLAHICALFLACCIFAGCVTIQKDAARDKKDEDLLSNQKALVVNFLNRGLTAMAYKELRQYIIKYPNDPDIKNLMGLTQLAMNNPQQAIIFFQKAYELNKKVSYGLNLSSAYIETGKYAEATKLLTSLKVESETDGYPHPERISHNLGLVSEKRGKLNEAETFYQEALNLNPNFFISQMRLGQVLQRLGKSRESLQQFAKAAQTCPVCFDPINALATSFIAMGNQEKATQVLKSYMKVQGVAPKDKARAKQLIRNGGNVSNAKSPPAQTKS